MGFKTLEEYFDIVITNFTDNAVYIARQRFEQLSQKQRKAFFVYLSDSCKIAAEDPMYKFFFEML